MHCNLLHLGNFVALILVSRGEASCPCGGIFDKRTGKRNVTTVGIAYGMRSPRIGHTAYIVNVFSVFVFHVGFCHYLAVFVAHHFHIDAFISRCGVAVI